MPFPERFTFLMEICASVFRKLVDLLPKMALINLLVGCNGLLAVEKEMRKAARARHIDTIEKKGLDPLTVERISIWNYTDSVFPNERLLKYGNLRSVFLSSDIIQVGHLPLVIDPIAIQQLPQLRFIRLHHFNLRESLNTLQNVAGIEGLNLTYCLIDTLPDEIGRLSELKYLSLRLNYLSSLPDALSHLDSLEVLDLSNNHLRMIPASLADMRKLKKINLANDEVEKEYGPLDAFRSAPMCLNHIDWETDTASLGTILRSAELLHLKLPRDECSEKLHLIRAYPGKRWTRKVRWGYKPNPCPDPWPTGAFVRPALPEKDFIDRGKCLCGILGY